MHKREYTRRNGPYVQTWRDYGPGAIQLISLRKDCAVCGGSGRISHDEGQCQNHPLCVMHDCERCFGVGSHDVTGITSET